MSQKVVKPWVKYAQKGVIVAAILGVLYYTASISGVLPTSDGSSKSSFFGSGDKDVITIGVNTFCGFMPMMLLNNGLEPTEDCILYKEYGIKAKIVIQDNFEAGRQAFLNDDINLIYCTVDALPTEMSESSEMAKAGVKYINISNWSRGADIIIANKHVQKVSDLIGKTICCSKGTASHTLLLNTLETSGITADQTNDSPEIMKDKINIKLCEDGVEAGKIFRAGAIDAAVIYSPEDASIIKDMPGSHALISTKQATSIICDGLIAKKAYLEKNKDKVKKFLSALLWANSEMNDNPESVKTAAKVFSKNFEFAEDEVMQCVDGIRYVTLEDEKNFFGLNSDYTGMTGQELYSKMSRTYSKLGLCQSPLAWNKVSDTSIIEELIEEGSVKGNQKAESSKTFAAPTKELEQAQEISTKKLVIEFATNSSTLDNNAKSLIDREFVSIAKQFAGARIRIEGNTDGTGSDAINVPLSKARAQAVADYLINEYGFDKNRFIVIGNGSQKSKIAGISGSSQYFRTTDFMLINE